MVVNVGVVEIVEEEKVVVVYVEVVEIVEEEKAVVVNVEEVVEKSGEEEEEE